MKPIRIAMWSGPRNISTAMMRAFEARGDCAVSDEPFYAAYLAASAPLVRGLAVAGATGRTLGIFVAVSAGVPWAYWLWEIFGVSAIAGSIALLLRRREAAVGAMAL